MLLAAVSSFALGGALVGYIVWYNVGSQEPAAVDEPAALVSASPSASPTETLAPSPTPIGEPVEPESAEEAVEAVSGLAERGDELGYLADQLRLRFGDERPNAVNTIINFSRTDPPIRLDTLLARLEGLGPQLAERDEGPSWAAFKRELSQLFVIRRESTPSPQPERRLERARYALEQGRYQNAIDEIRNMPGAEKAEAWIADAEKFRDAMAALENIETAAVLDQRGLRDGAGNLINQPSPIEGAGDD